MKIFYRATNSDTLEVVVYLATEKTKYQFLLRHFPETMLADWNVDEYLTPEGYRITTLRCIPRGTHFNLVSKRGEGPTAKATWVRSVYYPPSGKYECIRIDDDVRRCRELSGSTYVTIDVTF